MKFSLRLLYLYLFSFVGLIISVIGAIQIINLTLTTYVFKNSDIYYYGRQPKPDCIEGNCELLSEEESRKLAELEATRNRQRQLANSLSMLVVGVPLYLYHWRQIKKG